MDTIIIRTSQKSTSAFILEMAKRIKVKARLLKEDEIEDLRLNQILKEDEKKLEELSAEVIYKTLRKHGAEI